MADATDRIVYVDGLVNARDLGGLRRTDGGITPRGVFFRSESVDRIPSTGWRQLEDLGIRTVVDLRQPGERASDQGSRPSWLHTASVDLDGRENEAFWRDYWDNGLMATALYFLPHLRAMPERACAALSAIVSAPPGGVLFHCMGGRDRTGLISMLLLFAGGVDPEEIVDDYLETVRRGELRAASENRNNTEPDIELLCHSHGSTTEQAFRMALAALDFEQVLSEGGMNLDDRLALGSWRGHL